VEEVTGKIGSFWPSFTDSEGLSPGTEAGNGGYTVSPSIFLPDFSDGPFELSDPDSFVSTGKTPFLPGIDGIPPNGGFLPLASIDIGFLAALSLAMADSPSSPRRASRVVVRSGDSIWPTLRGDGEPPPTVVAAKDLGEKARRELDGSSNSPSVVEGLESNPNFRS
jgi:hypothetical protein